MRNTANKVSSSWRWVAALLLLAMSASSLSGAAAEKLNPDQVAILLPQLFKLHLSQRGMDAPFTKRLLKEYVNQLDPTRSFYLKGEAEALVNLSDGELKRIAEQALNGDFSRFNKIMKDFLETQIGRDGALYENLDKRADEIKALAKEGKEKVAVKPDINVPGKLSKPEVTEPKIAGEIKAATDPKEAPKPEEPNGAKVGEAEEEDDVDKIKWSERPADHAEREKRLLRATSAMYRLNRTYLSDTEAFKLAVQNAREDRAKWLAVKAADEVPKLFLKSFMDAMDPHTDYFDADEDEFTDRLERSFAGIGVQIRPCPLGAQIEDIIKGGPSEKSNKFARGDQIIAVDDFVLAGLPINKIVKRIKGKIGTEVKLTVRKRETRQTEVITLKRDTIELSEMRVKGKAFETPRGAIGLISVQTFYRGVHKDVRERIKQLSQSGPLAGVVLDLRFNHGGYLEEAVNLTGLFIQSGPVVGERDGDGKIGWKDDEDGDAFYTGPLVVLTNQFSASASEIVAGSLKDYGRAIIAGSSQTFGKGTVQRVIPLAGLNLPGEIKITTHQYFLAGGASVQLKGVDPDVTIPGPKLVEEDGMLERASENAVAWNQIPTGQKMDTPDVKLWHDRKAKNVAVLQKNSNVRVDANPELKDAFDPKKRKAKAAAEPPKPEAQRDPDEPPPPEDTKKEEKDLQAEEAVAVVQDMTNSWPKMDKQAAK